MEHSLDPAHGSPDRAPVQDVGPDGADPEGSELGGAGLLTDGRDDVVPAGEQLADDVAADETRCTRDKRSRHRGGECTGPAHW